MPWAYLRGILLASVQDCGRETSPVASVLQEAVTPLQDE